MVRYAHVALIAFAVLLAAGCSREAPAPAKAAMTPSPVITPPVVNVPASPPPPPTTGAVDTTITAKDSKVTNPTATLSKEQESNSMPMAGQVNNHSSPAFEPKKP